jgi:peptide/nickel transport system substrate-binding protein
MPKFIKQREKTTQLVKKVGTKASNLQSSSSQHVAKYVTRRAKNIQGVRRFVASWIGLVVILVVLTVLSSVGIFNASQVTTAHDGGTYTEGMIGNFTNLNPLFGSGSLDDSASRLIFNGLFRYDTSGVLVPDLAKDITVQDDRKTYKVSLKTGVLWHDGRPFTSKDVQYTIGAIQDPATRSPLYSSWQGIKVTVINQQELQFELPAPFAPFPGALTVPILPEHLLSATPYSHLRSASFNNQPVGTGPFVFSGLRSEQGREQQLELSSNKKYFRGEPALDRFFIHTYPNDADMARALKNREITAAVDLNADSVKSFSKDTSIRQVDIPLNSGVFAFFKTTGSILESATVRSALVQSFDRSAILNLFDARYTPLKTPLLSSQLGFDGASSQKTDTAAAEKLLDEAGWVKQSDGTRAKDGVPLELNLTTINSSQYTQLAGELQKQWGKVGVRIKSQLLTPEQLQQTALTAHNYDILLYGISLGHDPDVYAYWHSSQARPGGLNFSEWKSARADSSLETARTRLEDVLRIARYKTFQDEWLKSSPALALYQPRVNYAYHQNAEGFVSTAANNAADRLTNVEEWTVSTRLVEQTP